jgi:2-(1,2-epoxy-1,2-dihydrophenyl)acetyl-CoA isomerase
MYETVRVEIEGTTATLTLNRPEKLNAYTVRMGEELVDAFRRLRDDPAVRAVILTGAGRAFCAGVDLDLLRAQPPGGGAPGSASASAPRLGEEEFVRSFPAELQAFPKPVIAALNGPAIGVGVTMTLPCDVRLAAEGAKLGLTFTKLGLLPGLGSTHLLPRLVGMARALELVLTARVVEASEAARLGLVSEVVPAERLLPRARELAAALAEIRPEVLAAAKRALLYGARVSLEEALRNEARESAALRRTS